MNERLAADLERLVELSKEKGWNELRLKAGGVELLLSTDIGAPALDGRSAAAAAASPPPAALPASVEQASPAQTRAAPPPAATQTSPADVPPSWTAVRAPHLGTFYRSPKPGAPLFVEIGQAVQPDTEVCLLEVMKLFTSVKAEVSGVVRQVCASDAELVEGDQVLFYIEAA